MVDGKIQGRGGRGAELPGAVAGEAGCKGRVGSGERNRGDDGDGGVGRDNVGEGRKVGTG